MIFTEAIRKRYRNYHTRLLAMGFIVNYLHIYGWEVCLSVNRKCLCLCANGLYWGRLYFDEYYFLFIWKWSLLERKIIEFDMLEFSCIVT